VVGSEHQLSDLLVLCLLGRGDSFLDEGRTKNHMDAPRPRAATL
jgi:hypothetical protein